MSIPISAVGTLKGNDSKAWTSVGDSSRPTSVDVDVVGNGTFSVQARVANHVVFTTAPILITSSFVRHFKFRAPKSTDFGNGAQWSLATTGEEIKYSVIARFSSRTPVTEFPAAVEKPVVISEGMTVQELPRQWRYASTVA